MATKSLYLKLTKPLNNEFQDTWDVPMNENTDIIDSWALGIYTEIFDARHGKASLALFLDVAHNTDGTLKPTEEVSNARSSKIYGDETALAETFTLSQRLEQSDMEILDAREGFSDLRTNLAMREFQLGEVVYGAKDSNGYPTWLGYTGINVNVDGSSTVLWMKNNGLMTRVRTLKQIPVSGASGTKYLYAEYDSANGELVVDGDSTTPPPAAQNGTIGSDGTKVRLFEDLTQDFTTQNVQVGDLLEILGTSSNAGKYMIAEIAPSGDVHRLKIKGVFPGGAMASLDYNIWDMAGVTLGYDDTKTPSSTKFYFGEATWDGISVTAVKALPFGNIFIGEWRAVDLTSTPTFEETWNHNLLDDALQVNIQVSSANDGSQPVEQLSLCTLNDTLGLDVVNGITLTPNTSPLLSGSVSVSFTGSIVVDRSVYAQWTNYIVSVKNVTPDTFYKDYSGAIKQTGYIRVILSKIRK